MLIRCFGEYADRVCVENIGLRIYLRPLREIFYLANEWRAAKEWIDLQKATGKPVPELAEKICSEREAGLFIAVHLLAGTTLYNPTDPTQEVDARTTP